MKIVIILGVIALLWLLFAPNIGLIHLHQENQRLSVLKQQKNELEQENATLLLEIEKIQNDREYFEQLAREKHGLLLKNEVVFDFNRNKEEKKKQ